MPIDITLCFIGRSIFAFGYQWFFDVMLGPIDY